MEEYRSNSKANERKKVEPIASGKKQSSKKSGDLFFEEDLNHLKKYLWHDVLLPAVKDIVEDMVVKGIRVMLRGEEADRKSSTASKVSYRNYYKDNSATSSTSYTSNKYNDLDIRLDSRGECEEVIYRLEELTEAYGMVSVADLYDLVGITSVYTDNKYGWTTVQDVKVLRIREGYLLKMPKAKPL
ncbi:MAG: hypothetical protein R3Y53_01865 [Bacillota bacterium]